MLYASGAGSKAMALEVAIARSKAMKMTEPLGAGMAALGCGYEEAVKIVASVAENWRASWRSDAITPQTQSSFLALYS
jgi:hypothetical protein